MPLLGKLRKEIAQILSTSGSAFSWISSEAEVWRMKQVSKPVFDLFIAHKGFGVIAEFVESGPLVGTVRL